MNTLSQTYRPSLALLTDLYQLTMAYGYWKSGKGNSEAVFNLFFRKNPFKGGLTVACGLEHACDYLQNYKIDDADLTYLAQLQGNDGEPLFEEAFLKHLGELDFTCDIDATPEGTVVFPFEPILRVRGPLVQCQLLETPLLNIINFQTLIATKAARISLATGGDPVLEFGLRRAQGIDGALAASRAAYVGGCSATSNVLAGRLYGIPVKGTHAHAWVMSFDSERESFEAYAAAMPNNCVFLVDTYDTLEGVKTAVEVGKQLRQRGYEMAGVRLDSGDLAYLSIGARKILNEGGFPDAKIVASNDLDERVIMSLKQQGATIAVWGVGTKLVTAYDQPALGGVYKLAAIREPGEAWDYKVKLSEQAIKISNPGVLQVRRMTGPDGCIADAIYEEELGIDEPCTIVDPMDPTRRRKLDQGQSEDLLKPIFRGGKYVYDKPSLEQIRDRAAAQLKLFHPGIKRFVNPHQYPVGLEQRLYDLKTRLVLKARGQSEQ